MSDGSKPHNIKDRTFAFALDIVRFCQELKSSNLVTRRLYQQLLDSGTSIGANVEEAQAGQSRADFIRKLNIALKEARETVYWLRLLDASRANPDKTCTALRQEAEEIARVIASIIVIREKDRKENSIVMFSYLRVDLNFYFLILNF